MRFAPAIVFSLTLMAQPNPRELVRQSIINGQQAWKNSRAYTYLKQEVEKQLDASGGVRSTNTELYRIVPLGDDSFEEHLKHNGQPLAAGEQRKQQEELERREHESPEQRDARLAQRHHDRSYYKEIPDAFDFKITGEENLPTGPAWVITATPRPGYRAHTRYARLYSKMRGTLWIDKKDVQWVKADAEAADDVTFGYFLAKLSKGSHIILEQTRLSDGTWVPKHIEAKALARAFVFFNRRLEETIDYSDYHKGGTLTAAARR